MRNAVDHSARLVKERKGEITTRKFVFRNFRSTFEIATDFLVFCCIPQQRDSYEKYFYSAIISIINGGEVYCEGSV